MNSVGWSRPGMNTDTGISSPQTHCLIIQLGSVGQHSWTWESFQTKLLSIIHQLISSVSLTNFVRNRI